MRTLLEAPAEVWASVRDDLLSTPHLERAAVGYAGVVQDGTSTRLLLRDWAPVPSEEYLVQLGYHLEVSPVFWARAAKRARASNEALIIMHSHPSDPHRPRFSPSDDSGEADLVPKIHARANVPVVAIVMSPGGFSARVGDSRDDERPVDMRVVGEVKHRCPTGHHDAIFDRQIRALGRDGQALLRGLSVGVVGAGGLGSHVIQQLVHLGVGHVVVVDPDRVSKTNLSRLVGASRLDVVLRRRKTAIAQRLAHRVGGKTTIEAVPESVCDEAGARRLLSCDVVVGCTDNHWSRTVLNSLAFQYYLPVLDLGVELQATGAMGGRVAWLAPGRACMWCMDILDPERVRVEQLPASVRDDEAARGYIQGLDEPAPAVISINGVIASLGLTELLARTTGFAGSEPRSSLLLYRLADGTVRRTSPSPRPECPTCTASGLLGAGDLSAVPWARSDIQGTRS
jgi:molybdopterin/thiamine biosynthesis adenylyltransferase